MTIKCLDAGKQLAVVTARDEDLGTCADSGLEDGEGAGGELVLFDLSDLVLAALDVSGRYWRERRAVVRTSTLSAAC